MLGSISELDVLKPTAMSPDSSIAMLGIQRKAESGAYVPAGRSRAISR
jgi:hypothetical protein